jgi:hypothetical protein
MRVKRRPYQPPSGFMNSAWAPPDSDTRGKLPPIVCQDGPTAKPRPLTHESRRLG